MAYSNRYPPHKLHHLKKRELVVPYAVRISNNASHHLLNTIHKETKYFSEFQMRTSLIHRMIESTIACITQLPLRMRNARPYQALRANGSKVFFPLDYPYPQTFQHGVSRSTGETYSSLTLGRFWEMFAGMVPYNVVPRIVLQSPISSIQINQTFSSRGSDVP